MANCINITAPEYRALVKQSKWGQPTLRAKISV